VKISTKQRHCVCRWLIVVAILYPSASFANPHGAQIIEGQVSIDTSTPGVTTITNSPDSIINWHNFSISQNETTQFIQQDNQSAVLNRIIGENPSEILGQLISNGRVFLINPNGVVFGAGSVINTQDLIVSSLNLSNRDFLSGNYHFTAGSGTGGIVNEGLIRTGKGGNIVLIAPDITNNGVIQANGTITLAAGQELTITNLDKPNIVFQIQAATDSVLNLGQLLTEGGAINLFAGVIRHSGDISADSVEIDVQGNIRLIAQQNIFLESGSKISTNNSSGDAGTIQIESKAGTTLAQGALEAQAFQTGNGGHIGLLGERVGLMGQASIDVSGVNGGGEVLIGGGYQGKDPGVPNAKATYLGKDVTIKADAMTDGDGGKVIVWADAATRAYGTISARGGTESGNGGLIETSAHWLDVKGIHIDASGPQGKGGAWLLDPDGIIISVVRDSPLVTAGPDFTTIDPGLDTTAYLSTDVIEAALNLGTNVSVTTTEESGGYGYGDIIVNAPIYKSDGGDAALSLFASRNIYVNSDITSTAGRLDLGLTLGGRGYTDISDARIDLNYGALTSNGPVFLNSTLANSTINLVAGATLYGQQRGGQLNVTLDNVAIGSNLTMVGNFNLWNSLTLDEVEVTKAGDWYFDSPDGEISTYALVSLGSDLINQYGSIFLQDSFDGLPQTLVIEGDLGLEGDFSFQQLVADSAIINNGTLLFSSPDSYSSFDVATFVNSGVFMMDAPGMVFDMQAAFIQSGVLGISPGSTFVAAAGLTNTGTLSAGADSTLTVVGDLALLAGSEINIELAGADRHGAIAVTGNIAMAGTFNATLVDGYLPINAGAMPFLTMGGIASGNFDATNLPLNFTTGYNLAAGEAARLIYSDPVIIAIVVTESTETIISGVLGTSAPTGQSAASTLNYDLGSSVTRTALNTSDSIKVVLEEDDGVPINSRGSPYNVRASANNQCS